MSIQLIFLINKKKEINNESLKNNFIYLVFANCHFNGFTKKSRNEYGKTYNNSLQ